MDRFVSKQQALSEHRGEFLGFLVCAVWPFSVQLRWLDKGLARGGHLFVGHDPRE